MNNEKSSMIKYQRVISVTKVKHKAENVDGEQVGVANHPGLPRTVLV